MPPVRGSAEEGYTLIELIVYVSLFAVILVIAGGFLIDSAKVARYVGDAATATTAAEVISASVQSGVRNAVAVRVVSGAAPDDQVLLARTNSPSGGDVCRAWYYRALDKAVYATTSPSPAVAIVLPPAGPAGSWQLLGSGVKRIGLPTSPLPVFGPTVDSVLLSFEVSAGDGDPVRVETTVYARPGGLSGAPCF